MSRYGDLDALKEKMLSRLETFRVVYGKQSRYTEGYERSVEMVDNAPTVDAVEIETIKEWLYEIALYNVGCHVEDFASACEEIASRLDGLKEFSKERKKA